MNSLIPFESATKIVWSVLEKRNVSCTPCHALNTHAFLQETECIVPSNGNALKLVMSDGNELVLFSKSNGIDNVTITFLR